MSTTITHLRLRATSKRKKPAFIRQDAHKTKRIERKWRRPKGITNKIRLQRRGYRRRPETGWGSPRDVKHLSPEGKRMVLTATLADIENLNPKTDSALIAKTGAKKKLLLIAALRKKGIPIANINADAFEKAWQARLAAKAALKEKKAKSIEEKAKEEKKAEKNEEKKEETSSDATDEMSDEKKKKEKEKEEKDKLLTKRT